MPEKSDKIGMRKQLPNDARRGTLYLEAKHTTYWRMKIIRETVCNSADGESTNSVKLSGKRTIIGRDSGGFRQGLFSLHKPFSYGNFQGGS